MMNHRFISTLKTTQGAEMKAAAWSTELAGTVEAARKEWIANGRKDEDHELMVTWMDRFFQHNRQVWGERHCSQCGSTDAEYVSNSYSGCCNEPVQF
jgi:hypothetical protein